MSKINLLSCPFCGGKAEIINDRRSDGNVYYYVKYVMCEDCEAKTKEKTSNGYYGEYCTDEEIAEIWNTRKPMEKIVERLEEEKMRYFLTIANTGNEKLDAIYEEVGNVLDRVVEIIKEEGME